MQGPYRHKSKAAIAVVVIGALITWYSQRQPQKSRPVPRNAPPVSADTRDNTQSRPHEPRPEASSGNAATATHAGAHPLTIHGLWPERRKAGAYPHDCPAPRLDLAPALEQALSEYMPGVQSHLHEHEWRTHGTCSGLDDDEYFPDAIDLARNLDAALRPTLTTLASRDGPSASPGTPLDCARVNRRDQGCGSSFRIAELRR